MNKLKQNGFWVGVGAASLALIGALGYVFVVVRGQQADVRKKNNGLLTELKGKVVPGQPDIGHWKTHRKELIDAHTEIASLYSQSDRHLERWMDGLGDDPSRGEFFARYRDKIAELEKAVMDKKTLIGAGEKQEGKNNFGFNWEDPADAMTPLPPEEQKRILKELQKRYWARARVANIILNESARVTRVHDFRFFKRLSDKIPNPAWDQAPGGEHAVTYPGTGTGVGGFTEFDLPSDLGKTLTFGVALELPYSEVPKVIGELLNAGSEKGATERLLVNVVGTHVTIKSQNEAEKKIQYPEKEPRQFEEKVAEAKKSLKPNDVLLTVTCQMIDFEPSKIKPFQQ